MKWTVLLIPTLLLVACGPEATSGEPRIHFEVLASAAVADQAGKFQISVLNATSCQDVKWQTNPTCLKNEVAQKDLVAVKDAKGKEHPALLIDVNLEVGPVEDTQRARVLGVPAGRAYAVVIEAISKDPDNPWLLAKSCSVTEPIHEGINEITANALQPYPSPGLTCDPRWPQ